MKKQKYWKKENLKINKSDLVEVVGDRIELETFKNKEIICEVFITNTINYNGNKRLITEVKIPGEQYFIRHLWVDEINIPLDKVPHGYQTLKLKVISYTDVQTGETKYGVKVAEEKYKKMNKDKKQMTIPKWKQEMLEAEALKKEITNNPPKPEKPRAKSPFKKIKIVKKAKK